MATEQEIRRVKQQFGVIGESPALLAAIGRALRVAPIDLSVLIIGESGTGKEVFPKIIHANSPRRHKKYIAVNCGAIPEGTIDSELFGHVKGSFTGAISDHKGYFEEADGGVIFLDEVAEMPLSTQARLLRVLENGEYLRVGDSTVRKTNIRVVAATNKDMEQAVKDGRFREDLYYRLSTVQINVPPLRERGRDIVLLTRKFMRDFMDANRTAEVSLGDDANNLLLSYHWPGNVRQLKSVAEQVALFESGTVDANTLRQYMPSNRETALTVKTQPTYDYNTEREQLFTMLLSMRAEIEALKKRVENDASPASHVTANVAELKRDTNGLLGLRHNEDDTRRIGLSMPYGHTDDLHSMQELGHVDEINVTDVEDVPVKTLDETERETIENALRRNNGRRKVTAQELNISERTLYRKIKQYNLERE